MAKIGSLIADLGMNTAKFEAGIARSQGMLEKFSRSANRQFQRMNVEAGIFGERMLAIGAIGFGAMAKNAIDTADQMEKLSIKTGITTEALSQLKFAGEQSDIEFNTLSKSMEKMVNAVGEARAGLVTYTRAFEALGVNVDELAALAPEKQLEVLADAFRQVTDQTDKTAIAMDIFGARGTAMLQMFEQGSQGIRDLRVEAHNLGVTLTQEAASGAANANDAINRAKTAMNAMALESTTNLAPAIESIANGLADIIPKAASFAVNAFFKLREHALGVLSFIINKYATFKMMVADVLQSTGIDALVAQGEKEGREAQFLALFSANLLKSSQAAAVVGKELKVVTNEVEKINQQAPDIVERYKGMVAVMEGSKTKAKELGQTIKVDIFDSSKNVFEQMRDQWKANLANMVNDWVTSGLGKIFKGIFGNSTSGFGGFFSSLFGFANGGSFEVGGKGGTDANLVAFKATKGETVHVNRPGETRGMGGGSIIFQNSYDFSGSTLSESEVRQMIEDSSKITTRQIQNSMIRGRF